MLPASLSAKWLPRDFVVASQAGGLLTIVAYVVMLTMFTCELRAFLVSVPVSSLLLEGDVHRPNVQINLDVDVYGVDCRNLNVMVIDQFRAEPVHARARELRFRALGGDAGTRVLSSGEGNETEEEEHQRTAKQLEKQDGAAELDADWAASHDGFKHEHFDHVIKYHDFTMINFFAGWCSHCQHFAPSWMKLAEQVKERTFEDRDQVQRKVGAIKVNCVDFKDLCREQGINAYPTIRLYKSDGTVSLYEGKREIAAMIAWIELVLKTKSFGWRPKHQDWVGGCNVRGYLRVPRVPGHLELMAGGGDQNLLPSMTNTSHKVNHFTFREPSNSGYWRLWSSMPKELTGPSPIDGKRYLTNALHQVYEHHLRLVSAVTTDGAIYQFVHYGRIASVAEDVVPQVRFHYDFEPFAIQVEYEEKPWYEFATSLLAALGGIFVFMRLLSRAVLTGGYVLGFGSGNSGNGLVI